MVLGDAVQKGRLDTEDELHVLGGESVVAAEVRLPWDCRDPLHIRALDCIEVQRYGWMGRAKHHECPNVHPLRILDMPQLVSYSPYRSDCAKLIFMLRTNCELDFNSAERIFEYINDVPHEQAGVIENARPPAHWPSSSGPNADQLLAVQNLEIKYAPDLPSVLHDVSFTLKAGERVGIIGRTGSGKSTLAMSFLRFVEPTSGSILIDGIDITKIGVRDLRSRVSFVPQDAVLFAGTIRENLNPFGEYDDAMCWDALKRVHLVAESSSLPLEIDASENSVDSADGGERSQSENTKVAAITLDSEVSAGGKNFSEGQRQLLAMARAILRRSAIVILDEATSSIDFDTDEIIQRTIREEFSNGLLISSECRPSVLGYMGLRDFLRSCA